MPSYKVRPAVDSDAEAIASVHAASSRAAYEGLVPDQHDSLPMEKRRAFWRDAIEYSEPQVHVALDEAGALVGFTGFDRSRDPKSRPTTGEIWALYVLPSHWNKGAGLALWDAAREGLVEERNQGFGESVGQRPKAGAESSAEDEGLIHVPDLPEAVDRKSVV